MIDRLLDKVLSGEDISLEEGKALLGIDKFDIPRLREAADKIRQRFCGDRIDLCSLVNAKSGLCPEDCKYCAQSSRYDTGCSTYPLLDIEKIVEKAKEAKANKASNFCIVISGTGPTKEDFEKIKTTIKRIQKEVGIKMDVSLGKISKKEISELKEIGIERYNHNLETSEDYYPSICTTHDHSIRVDTVKDLKDMGLEVCSGGIIGMGESEMDRLKLAFKLRELEVECVPINILNPRKGTPLEGIEKPSLMDIIKTVAIFRFILPRSTIKIAGGREYALGDDQAILFRSGANGMIIGGYLTTKGNAVEKDLEMVRGLGYNV